MDPLTAIVLAVARAWRRRSFPDGTRRAARLARPATRPDRGPEPSWRWRQAAATMAHVQLTYRRAPKPLKAVAWAVALALKVLIVALALAAAERLGVHLPFLGGVV